VRLIGCLAAVLLVIVGCTSVTDGTPTADTAIAPAYRASVSASSVTSRIRESQRQASLTTQAVVRACESFATTSKDAIEKVNDFVAAYNQGRETTSTEGPAIDALNRSADAIAGSISAPSGSPLSADLRDALNAYGDAARDVANAIGNHAGTGEFNQRVNQLNDSKTKAVKVCLAS
jgi:hypothetical protein